MSIVQKQFPCKNCGAALEFSPGTTALTCPYCGTVNQIDAAPTAMEELDFLAALNELANHAPAAEVLLVHCNSCGAETTLGDNVTAGRCPFCASPIVTAAAQSERRLRPQSLLPFQITRKQATEAFGRWVRSLWFAPSALKRTYQSDGINGVYIPAWTYDSDTESDYTGQRGEDYWETEWYTAHINGRSERRSRQVRKTRWYPAAGRVRVSFDDLLVIATDSLPPKQTDALEPWDLKSLVGFQQEFLAGFVAESYRIDLRQGFESARQQMRGPIEVAIARDIGGDHQRISGVDTRYHNITFKHILLPVWISAYHFQLRVFRFLVNARTGEVQGERPYSALKIALFVLMWIIIAAVVLFIQSRSG